MSKEVQQFLEMAKQVKTQEFLRHCRICGKVVAHRSVQVGIEETLTCLRCEHQERFNTK